MKQDNNYIDELFRRSLKELQVEPPDIVKTNIFKKFDGINYSNNKKNITWGVLGISLFVCLVGITLYLFHNNVDSVDKNTNNQTTNNVTTNIRPVKNIFANKNFDNSNTNKSSEIKNDLENKKNDNNLQNTNVSGKSNETTKNNQNLAVKNNLQNTNASSKSNETTKNNQNLAVKNNLQNTNASSKFNETIEETNISASNTVGPTRQSRLSVDLFISPSIVLTSNAEFIRSAYGSANKKSLLSFNWGVEAKYDINNIFLQSGVNYSAYRGKINYNIKAPISVDTSKSDWNLIIHTVIVSIDTSWVVIDSIPTPVFDTTYVDIKDSTWKHSSDTTFFQQNGNIVNKITYIEFPLLVGYSFRKGNMSFRVATGIAYGILSGNHWSPALPNIDSLVNTGPWKKNIYNYILRVGCIYHVNDLFSLFIQPSLRINLNSLFDKDFAMAKKYHILGFNIGVNFKF